MSSGRWAKRGWAFQARADAGWALANGGVSISVAVVTTRLSLVGTSRQRLAVSGTSAERMNVTGTSQNRLTIEGASR